MTPQPDERSYQPRSNELCCFPFGSGDDGRSLSSGGVYGVGGYLTLGVGDAEVACGSDQRGLERSFGGIFGCASGGSYVGYASGPVQISTSGSSAGSSGC